ncbi:MAG: serine/threonine protein kinase [Candidatus Pacebacteria bacterium]|nr:serine/threonine protein kinase [Candidatus Paceibacterota bacterium]
MTTAKHQELRPGDIVAGYKVEAEIGRGAMGVVYRAIQINLERPAALKILAEEFSQDREYVNRFFNEAKAAGALSHPNIVQAYDAGVADNDICYFAMELVDGETLLERIDRETCLASLTALRIARAVAAALDYGWNYQKLTHGDIKPANIMLTSRDETKLADFGLAKIGDHELDEEGIILTPLYAAPEVIEGQTNRDSCSADIYSFGATLYHMLTGTPPFPGEDSKEVMRAQVQDPLIPARNRNPNVPRQLSNYVDRLMAKSPGDRPQSWENVIRSLDRLLQALARGVTVAQPTAPGPIQAKPTHPAPAAMPSRPPLARSRRHTNRSFLAWGVLALLCLMYLLLWAWHESRTRQAPPTPQPPPQAQPAMHTTWQAFTRRLQREQDPQRCLELLRLFQQEHPVIGQQHLRDLNRLTRNYEKLVDVQDESEEPQPPSSEDVLTSDQPPKPDVPELTSPEKPIDEEHPEPEPPSEQGPSLSQRRRLEQRVADDYLILLQSTKETSYGNARDLTLLKEEAEDWLHEHQITGKYTTNVEFLAHTVIPAANHLTNAITDNKHRVLGKPLPTHKNREIKDITTQGLELEARIETETGTVSAVEKVMWVNVSQQTLTWLAAQMVGKETPLSPGEQQPFLAFLLFSGNSTKVTELVEAWPDRDGKRRWLLLLDDLSTLEREKHALHLWQQAKEAHEAGEYLHAFRTLEILNSKPNYVRQRYADEIDAVRKACEDNLPINRASEQLARVRILVDTDPSQALTILSDTLARYGALDITPAEDIANLRSQALRNLYDMLSRRDTSIQSVRSVAPLPFGPHWLPRGTAAAVCFALAEREMAPQMPQGLLSILSNLALLDVGDWQSARRALGEIRDHSARDSMNQRLELALLYSEALLAERYGPITAENRNQLRAFQHAWQTARPSETATIATLCGEFSIASEQAVDATQLTWPSVEELGDKLPPSRLKTIWLAHAAVAVESNDTQAYEQLVQTLKKSSQRWRLIGLSPVEWDALQNALQWFRGEQQTGALPYPDAGPGSELFNRLVLSAVLRSGVPNKMDRILRHWEAARQLPGRGPLVGRTCFDILLLHVGDYLVRNEPETAIELVESILRWHHPDMAAYYPRLLILKSGLHMLADDTAAARQALSLIRYSTVASETELTVAGYLDNLPQSPGTPGEWDQTPFWKLWLVFAYNAQNSDWREASNEVAKMAGQAKSPPKQQFVYYLRQLLENHTAHADPQPIPVPVIPAPIPD